MKGLEVAFLCKEMENWYEYDTMLYSLEIMYVIAVQAAAQP